MMITLEMFIVGIFGEVPPKLRILGLMGFFVVLAHAGLLCLRCRACSVFCCGLCLHNYFFPFLLIYLIIIWSNYFQHFSIDNTLKFSSIFTTQHSQFNSPCSPNPKIQKKSHSLAPHIKKSKIKFPKHPPKQ